MESGIIQELLRKLDEMQSLINDMALERQSVGRKLAFSFTESIRHEKILQISLQEDDPAMPSSTPCERCLPLMGLT